MPYIVVRMEGKEAIPVNPQTWPEPTDSGEKVVIHFEKAVQAEYWVAVAQRNYDRQRSGFFSRKPKITFQVRPIRGDRKWKERERERFTSGHYKPLPWHKTQWAKKPPKACIHHFPHLSQKDPTKIAFTENRDKGEFDKKTLMSPRKYFKKFYSKHTTERVIDRWLKVFKKLYGPHDKLEFAYKAEDITAVYRVGPRSCMTGCPRVGAYAGPDLAVAFIKKKGRIVARSVVWPKKKLHTRTYGKTELIEGLLQEQGYTRGRFKGARINKKHGIPSLDCSPNGYGNTEDGKYYRLLG